MISCPSSFFTAERLHDFDILLSDIGPPLPTVIDEQYHLCKHRSGHSGHSETETLYCDHAPFGRFIYISINGTTRTELLTICKLEVFGKWNLKERENMI